MLNCSLLADSIALHRESILDDWRQQVRMLPVAKHLSDPVLNDHIPHLLDELITALKVQSHETIPEALENMSAYSHGIQRLGDSYDIVEVVAEYNVLRGCIHDCAANAGISLTGKPFHILNRTMDGAIGLAVQTYSEQQALTVRRNREEYLSFLVHDLRTPLNAISMTARVLERKLKGLHEADSKTPLLLETLHRNVTTLSLLVAGILEENTVLMNETSTKVEARLFDLWPLIEALIQDLDPVACNKTCLISNDVPYEVMVYGDANLLRRVFRNLIANAIQYTPNGEVNIGAMKRGTDGAVECWVKDTGAGVPEERLEKIFQKLETDSERDDGVGLGLAIVESFVKAHNGEVTVESKEGVGSTFHLFLPGPPGSESIAA